ncbi:serine/threonine protein kinase [Rosistilla oblonga]|uniref:serine/threonine protein kinase n=1 Tax=Rosistilla oblonga TaxID=2527990 RepID=UPI003A96E0EC
MPHAWDSRWKIEEPLGKGGQGLTHIVSFVDDPTIRGALKHLKNNRNQQARSRMRREVVNLQALSSIGGDVPRVLEHNTDTFEDNSTELYVVMDLIEGPTLAGYVKQAGHLEIDTAIQFTKSLCKTIKLAHEFPLLHRDLKPDNIVVRDGSQSDLVIIDYGLSFNAQDEDITEIDETFRNRFLDLPETNTPSGDRRDLRSDLTAVCAVLYFCLTGHKPGQLQDGAGELPHMRSGFALRDIHNDERISSLEEFLTRGFAANINNRFQNVDEIATRLDELLFVGSDFDSSDPFQLSQSLSLQLRASDRTTQLAEFRQHAKSLLSYISDETRKYRNKLAQFVVSNGSVISGFNNRVDNAVKIGIPAELDFVSCAQLSVSVKSQHHPQVKHRLYAVASRGEQCVLLASDFEVSGENRIPMSKVEFVWSEIAWFEGDAKSIHKLVSIVFRDWVSSKMKELTAEILSGDAADA